MSYIGAKLWNDLPSDFKETTCLTDFEIILQTRTGPDLNDPFRSYVWAPSDSLYKSEILFVSYIESRFYTPTEMSIALPPCAGRSVRVGYSR